MPWRGSLPLKYLCKEAEAELKQAIVSRFRESGLTCGNAVAVGDMVVINRQLGSRSGNEDPPDLPSQLRHCDVDPDGFTDMDKPKKYTCIIIIEPSDKLEIFGKFPGKKLDANDIQRQVCYPAIFSATS